MMNKTRQMSSLVGDRTSDYARKVLSGEIVAGPHVRNACRRHFDDLERGSERGIWFDHDAAERAFRFFEGVLRLSEGQFEGQPFRLHPSQAFIVGSLFGWKKQTGYRRFRRAYIEQGKGNGKALALDTPIPTPSGWTTMGELKYGDELFDDRGNVCRVIQAHPVSHDRDCYRVSFDDGESIIASAEHLWLTEKRVASKSWEHRATYNVKKDEWGAWRRGIRTTKEISETLRYPNGKYQSANHSIPLCGPIKLPDQSLPIPPYTFGVWLGDGDSDCARITCAYSDRVVIDNIEADGVPVTEQTRHSDTTGRFSLSNGIKGQRDTIQSRLASLGVLGNKHIPLLYLRSSIEQRISLLQGLMDSDGSAMKSGACEFSVCNKELAQGVFELVRSLGIKATMLESDAKLNLVSVGRRYRIQFRAPDIRVFRLERKQARNLVGHNRRRLSSDRRIVSCEKLANPVPVRCITVDSPTSMFLAGSGMIPTHNSPLCGGVGIYGLAADGEAGSQVYAAAAKKDQANILFRDAVKMVQASPALAKRIAMSGGPGREYNMAYHANGSFFRPVSRDTGKSGSGPRPHFVLADEVHEMPDASILEILERGFKFRRQPLLVMITNSGSDRNSVAWNEREWAVRVASGNREDNVDDGIAYVGEPLDDETFSYVCALDIGDDPLNDKSCWVKANPLLGVTITEEYLQGVVLQAKNIPSKQNNILRLHFCEWTDADVAWMSREVVEPLLADYCLSEHKGKQITLGVDLSRSRDITAMGCVVKTGEKNGKPTFDCWVEAWTPGDTMQQRSERDKLPYPLWAEQGHIHAPPGENINYRHVAQTVFEYNRDFDIRMIAYDRYAFRKFEDEVKELGLDLNFVEHPQGGTRKGRPTEDMIKAAGLAGREPEGLWFPSSLRLFEDAMLEGRVRLKRNPVLISAIMSAVLERDKWDNAWLSKQRSVNKIDAAVALVMAFGAAHAVAMDAKPDYNIHFFSIGR